EGELQALSKKKPVQVAQRQYRDLLEVWRRCEHASTQIHWHLPIVVWCASYHPLIRQSYVHGMACFTMGLRQIFMMLTHQKYGDIDTVNQIISDTANGHIRTPTLTCRGQH